MTSISLPVEQPTRTPRGSRPFRAALVGNPNSGKTTLFNRLTGLNAKTSNFPGTTLECRRGRLKVQSETIELIDLPGLYSTQFAQSEEQVAVGALHGALPGLEPPDAVVVVIDATCLSRHLYLASEVREIGVPMLVALTMIDEARRAGITICIETLAKELDATVVPVSGRTGEGIDQLSTALTKLGAEDPSLAAGQAQSMTERIACTSCSSCPHTNRHTWACGAGLRAGHDATETEPSRLRELADQWLTHPLLGVVGFSIIMAAVFVLIFNIAAYPMDWIDLTFSTIGEYVGGLLPEGLLASFIVDGLIGGVGGVVIFLPQICLLFFALTLLEDTGYLARAAFVADRIMQKVGLPGKAFIPMLSAHACAIPGIMSTKVIESRRDRLITILVLPFMTCSARLPVYAMITAMLFADSLWKGGVVFLGAYMLGIIVAMCASFVLGKTILRGKPQELVIELPPYRWPSLRTAVLTMIDRGAVFLKQAGTVILLLSILLWAAATFPQLPEDQVTQIASPADAAQYEAWAAEADALAEAGSVEDAQAVESQMGNMYARYALQHSVAGRVGKVIEPVFEPLGFDWRIDIGVVTSFAAREVMVSTLSIVAGLGEEGAEDNASLVNTLRRMERPDGSPLFTTATSFSLLVFFVLAMQCLPTQAVTKRETGSWKWAVLQFSYMTVVAYVAAFITYQVALLLT